MVNLFDRENRKGKQNSGHEKGKGGERNEREQGLIRSHGKFCCCGNESTAHLAEVMAT